LLAPVLALAQAPYDLSPLERILEDALGPFVPGLTLTLEQNGSVIYSRTVGASGSNGRIPIASATKWYSGALIMALVDRGRLSLDDPVSKWLPEYGGAKAAITVRQLFSHTSGLPEDAPCLAARDMSLARCAAEIASVPLDAAPGTRFSYGGASMQVGGRIAELAGGAPWHVLFDETIARPLGFTCTAYDVFGAPENPRIAGGATSCTSDYLRFLRMLLNRGAGDGRRVLSPGAVAQLLADQTAGVPIAFSPYQSFSRLDPALPAARYGIGVWRERSDPSGELEVASSQGAFGFTPFIDFKRNLTGVLAVTGLLANVMPAYVEIQRVLRGAVPVAPLRSASVVNGASFLASGAVAPNQLVSIFGDWPSAPSRVFFDGVAQTPIFATTKQLNVTTPAALTGKLSTGIQLELAGSRTPAVTIGVIPADPALFTADGSGSGCAAVWQQADSVIALFGTGLGQDSVGVEIGGRRADVLYAGPAPGLVPAVTQINVRVPVETKPGAALMLTSGPHISAQRTCLCASGTCL
jgi:uncharacterized protein (TIGR03437 family)